MSEVALRMGVGFRAGGWGLGVGCNGWGGGWRLGLGGLGV